MKVLNRPMFRYGGPIKEGIMSGIKEPRQKYQDAGSVFKNVQAVLQDGTAADPKVLNEAAKLGIGNPYRTQEFKPYKKKVVTKPTDLSEMDIATAGGYGEIEKPYIEYQKIPKYIEDVDGDGIRDLNPEYTKNKTFLNDIFGGPYEPKTNQEFKSTIKTGPAEGTEMPPMLTKDTGANMVKNRVDDVNNNENNNVIDRKEKVNSILEGLGYDRAQKNALYDAMIKAGQRISRTGLGADNLVSDVIAETSQSYDKPEKLREAANLMQVQQDLKLDQIEASKTGGTLKQNYDFYISQGDSKEVAEKKARSLPTTITEKFNASKANTDSGKVYNVTMELTEEGFFGDGKEYNGRIAKKYDKDGGLKEFLVSEDFKGDGVYNFKGEAILIEDGQVKKRTIIQPKVEKEGFFS